MKIENFDIQSSLEANYLNITLQQPINFDNIAIKVITEDCPDFLIPFKLYDLNDQYSFRYKLINTVALKYFTIPSSKLEYIKLFKSLLFPFIKGSDWFLDYHYLCVDPQFVYIDKMNDRALFIYIPENSYRNSEEDILNFFEKILQQADITDDSTFLVKLYQYFNKGDVSLLGLYQLLETENPTMKNTQTLVKMSHQEPISQQLNMRPTITNSQPIAVSKSVASSKPASVPPIQQPSHDTIPVNHSSQNEDEVMSILYGDKGKKGQNKKLLGKKEQVKQEKPKSEKAFLESLFGKKKEPKNKQVTSQNTSENVISNNQYIPQQVYQPITMPADDVTQIIGVEDDMCAGFLELIYSPIPGAPTRINLDFESPFITIGRISSDEEKPNVAFSSEFKRIGRKHARITREKDGFYIIDLGSANHTMLNGQLLVPNQPYKLVNGTELSFTVTQPIRYKVNL